MQHRFPALPSGRLSNDTLAALPPATTLPLSTRSHAATPESAADVRSSRLHGMATLLSWFPPQQPVGREWLPLQQSVLGRPHLTR